MDRWITASTLHIPLSIPLGRCNVQQKEANIDYQHPAEPLESHSSRKLPENWLCQGLYQQLVDVDGGLGIAQAPKSAREPKYYRLSYLIKNRQALLRAALSHPRTYLQTASLLGSQKRLENRFCCIAPQTFLVFLYISRKHLS